MDQKAHLRIEKVTPNEKRHRIIYRFSNGSELTVQFVCNLRAAWQSPYFLCVHSVWLSKEGGTQLLGGVVHSPAVMEPSTDCYFFGSDSLTQGELRTYLEAAHRRVIRTWGRHKEFAWLARKSTVGGWRTIMGRLAEEDIPPLPSEFMVNAVPGIS